METWHVSNRTSVPSSTGHTSIDNMPRNHRRESKHKLTTTTTTSTRIQCTLVIPSINHVDHIYPVRVRNPNAIDELCHSFASRHIPTLDSMYPHPMHIRYPLHVHYVQFAWGHPNALGELRHSLASLRKMDSFVASMAITTQRFYAFCIGCPCLSHLPFCCPLNFYSNINGHIDDDSGLYLLQ